MRRALALLLAAAHVGCLELWIHPPTTKNFKPEPMVRVWEQQCKAEGATDISGCIAHKAWSTAHRARNLDPLDISPIRR